MSCGRIRSIVRSLPPPPNTTDSSSTARSTTTGTGVRCPTGGVPPGSYPGEVAHHLRWRQLRLAQAARGGQTSAADPRRPAHDRQHAVPVLALEEERLDDLIRGYAESLRRQWHGGCRLVWEQDFRVDVLLGEVARQTVRTRLRLPAGVGRLRRPVSPPR